MWINDFSLVRRFTSESAVALALMIESRPLTVLQLCFSSGGGLVSSVGGSASARWALRNADFSSLFRFFSSPRARAALARSARSRHRLLVVDHALVGLYKHLAMPSQRHGCASNYKIGIIETAWRHGKSESTPSLTEVFRQRTSHLNFFAKITSAPMSFHFCADGVAVAGTVWIPAAQSKRRLSAGASVDESCDDTGGEERDPARWPVNGAASSDRQRLPMALYSFEPIFDEKDEQEHIMRRVIRGYTKDKNLDLILIGDPCPS
jgi:hypothetical protein